MWQILQGNHEASFLDHTCFGGLRVALLIIIIDARFCLVELGAIYSSIVN